MDHVPSCNAPDAVMTLFTDPGSYTSTMAGFRRRAGGAVENRSGSNQG